MYGLNSFLSSYSGATALNVASSLFSMYAGTQAANQRADYYDYQAAQDRSLAKSEADLGVVQAGRVRAAGKRDVSKLTAAAGASGVSASSGSVIESTGDLSRRVELDALGAILEGGRKAYDLNVRAGLASAAASNERDSGKYILGQSLLGGLSKQSQIDNARRRGQYGSSAGSVSDSYNWLD